MSQTVEFDITEVPTWEMATYTDHNGHLIMRLPRELPDTVEETVVSNITHDTHVWGVMPVSGAQYRGEVVSLEEVRRFKAPLRVIFSSDAEPGYRDVVNDYLQREVDKTAVEMGGIALLFSREAHLNQTR